MVIKIFCNLYSRYIRQNKRKLCNKRNVEKENLSKSIFRRRGGPPYFFQEGSYKSLMKKNYHHGISAFTVEQSTEIIKQCS